MTGARREDSSRGAEAGRSGSLFRSEQGHYHRLPRLSLQNIVVQQAQAMSACTGWEWVYPEEESFWKAALVEDVRRIAWVSRRSAPEYCDLLEWLWRLAGFTLLFEALVLMLAQQMPFAAVARTIGESWHRGLSDSGHGDRCGLPRFSTALDKRSTQEIAAM